MLMQTDQHPIPVKLYHPQCATSAVQRRLLATRYTQTAAAGATIPVHQAQTLGNTTFAETTPLPNVWRFHRHKTTTLAELNLSKCINKRNHPTGSKDRRDAAALRFKETGRFHP